MDFRVLGGRRVECAAACTVQGVPSDYRERRATEARNLAQLTGWSLDRIRGKMAINADWSSPEDHRKWWEGIWKN